MKKKTKKYTDEFRLQIVKLIEAGKPKAEVLREYGLPEATVGRLVKKI